MTLVRRYAVLRSVGLAVLLLNGFTAQAQFDSTPRQILHVGFEESLRDDGPYGAYFLYYWNMANVPATNQFLRLAITPGYINSELAFKGLLGENTDLALGAFGGLYGNNYREVRDGNYYRTESFDGNGGGGNLSIYHRLNPGSRIPLTAVLRGSVNYATFDNTSDTANNFVMPHNQPFNTLRAGLRWGGIEPILNPVLATEVSGWYELVERPHSGLYGFSDDRRLEATSQRMFGRALIRYTTPRWQHYITAGLQGGTVLNADRFSAYRLGGTLQYTREFSSDIPGYFFQELSAKNFGLLNASYTIPFGAARQWNVTGSGAAALVDYVDNTGQSGAFNSGVGVGLGYSAPNRRWKVTSLVGYGFEAQRSYGSGGYSAALAFQYNFGTTKFASDDGFEKLQRKSGVIP